MRAIWRELVAEMAGFSLNGEFSCASAAIAAIRRTAPDVVLLDIQLSEGSGMDVMHVVAQEYPMTKVIVVSNYADPIYRSRFVAAGAYAFFDKSHEIAAMRSSLARLAAPASATSGSGCFFVEQ